LWFDAIQVVQDVNSIFPYKEWCKPLPFLLAVADILQSSVHVLRSVVQDFRAQGIEDCRMFATMKHNALSACGLMPFTVVQDVNSIFPYKEWCKPFPFLLAVANILQSSIWIIDNQPEMCNIYR